jgi:glycosidase
MPIGKHPTLYQINLRILLNQISRNLGRQATLDDITDTEFISISNLGFDWIYLLGIWQTGEFGKQLVRNNPEWRKEYKRILPDLKEDDLCSSCFAITGYHVDPNLGGDPALIRLRNRVNANGLRLMLDFIPNHTAIDHPWVNENPEMYISGTEKQLQLEPRNYIRLTSSRDKLILAHGRDPNFPGWSDTLQLDYGNPAVREAMATELYKVTEMCDGVRCDMGYPNNSFLAFFHSKSSR